MLIELDCNPSEDLAYDSIKEHLFVKVIAPINDAIVDTAPISELIVKCINLHDSKPLFPSEFKKHICLLEKGIDPAEIQKVINTLVNANFLRYNGDGRLVWHSRFVETEIKAQYAT